MPSLEKEPVLPTEAEVQAARVLARMIAAGLGKGDTLKVQLGDAPERGPMALPPIASRLVLELLEEIARGHAVSLTSLGAELTLQEVAGLLNVSNATVLELLDEGALSHRMFGNEQRIPLEEALAYKADLYAARKATLDDLVAHDQALGLE